MKMVTISRNFLPFDLVSIVCKLSFSLTQTQIDTNCFFNKPCFLMTRAVWMVNKVFVEKIPELFSLSCFVQNDYVMSSCIIFSMHLYSLWVFHIATHLQGTFYMWGARMIKILRQICKLFINFFLNTLRFLRLIVFFSKYHYRLMLPT